jgi:adenylate kinase family enzyme
VKERLAQSDCQTKGWLLDGFPRTGAQAEALVQAGISADVFVFLNVPDADLIERVVGRRTDPVTGKIYHMKFSPPESEEVRSRLTQRSDDTEEKVKVRLQAFHQHLSSIIGKYEAVKVELDGTQNKHRIFDQLCAGVYSKLPHLRPPPRLIIAGAPASGKGTQCELIKERFGVVHLSTGDMLREAAAKGTEVGLLAKQFMDQGKLVPDEVIIGAGQSQWTRKMRGERVGDKGGLSGARDDTSD